MVGAYCVWSEVSITGLRTLRNPTPTGIGTKALRVRYSPINIGTMALRVRYSPINIGTKALQYSPGIKSRPGGTLVPHAVQPGLNQSDQI